MKRYVHASETPYDEQLVAAAAKKCRKVKNGLLYRLTGYGDKKYANKTADIIANEIDSMYDIRTVDVITLTFAVIDTATHEVETDRQTGVLFYCVGLDKYRQVCKQYPETSLFKTLYVDISRKTQRFRFEDYPEVVDYISDLFEGYGLATEVIHGNRIRVGNPNDLQDYAQTDRDTFIFAENCDNIQRVGRLGFAIPEENINIFTGEVDLPDYIIQAVVDRANEA